MKKPATPDRPAPPARYTAEARGLWQDATSGWTIDRVATRILGTACEALMRVREAQTILARDGLTLTDRFGQQKVHPMVLVERDAQSTMLTALRHLNLDLEPLRDARGHPPSLGLVS
jgi:hypothetical protein